MSSFLANLTGVHISPHGFHIDPKQMAHAASFIPGVGSAFKIGSGILDRMGGSPPNGSYDPEGDALYGTETSPSDPNEGGGPNKWLMGLAGLQGLNSAYLGHKANNLSNDALDSVKSSYAERAGLRKAGISGLLHPQARDTSELTRIASHNAYASPTPPPPHLAGS